MTEKNSKPYEMGKKRNEILIGGFNAVNELYTEERDYKIIADCGVDFILLSYLHDEKSDFNISMLEKYGVKAFIYDGQITHEDPDSLTNESIIKSSAPYKNSSCFLGFGIIDEPGEQIFPRLGKTVAAIEKTFPGSLYHINLLPWYAFNDTKIFRHHLDAFAENVNLNHISTDDYPLWRQEDGHMTTNSCYYTGLYTSATVAKENGREHWLYIYSYSKTAERGYRVYTQNDLFFQAYSGLAFGACKILYFCFDVTGYHGIPSDNKDLPYCMRNYARECTELFDYAKVLNKQLHALSDVYSQYRWEDTNSLLCNGKNERFLLKLTEYKGDLITDVTTDAGLALGTFSKADGDGYAMMITNAAEISESVTAHFTFRADKASKITAHIDCSSEELIPVNGVYSFELAPGMGVFLTADIK